MERRVIVCAGCAESKKILGSMRNRLAEDLELNVAVGGMELLESVSPASTSLRNFRDLTVTDMAKTRMCYICIFNTFRYVATVDKRQTHSSEDCATRPKILATKKLENHRTSPHCPIGVRRVSNHQTKQARQDHSLLLHTKDPE